MLAIEDQPARRFLAGMIDADERERVLRLIASADRMRPNGKDGAA